MKIIPIIILSLVMLLSCSTPEKPKQAVDPMQTEQADSIARVREEKARRQAELQVIKETNWLEETQVILEKQEERYFHFMVVLPAADTMTREALREYCTWFKKMNCEMACTVDVFTSDDAKHLYTEFNHKDDDYLLVADRYAATLMYTDYFGFYPYQDMRYDALGGENWKK